jgi:hypothetical protein
MFKKVSKVKNHTEDGGKLEATLANSKLLGKDVTKIYKGKRRVLWLSKKPTLKYWIMSLYAL